MHTLGCLIRFNATRRKEMSGNGGVSRQFFSKSTSNQPVDNAAIEVKNMLCFVVGLLLAAVKKNGWGRTVPQVFYNKTVQIECKETLSDSLNELESLKNVKFQRKLSSTSSCKRRRGKCGERFACQRSRQG